MTITYLTSHITSISNTINTFMSKRKTQITKRLSSQIQYKYTIIHNLDKSFIDASLKTIPNYWSFEFVNPSSVDYEIISTNNNWKNFIFPSNKNYILFFDGVKQNVLYPSGTNIKNRQIGIAQFHVDYSPYLFGLRIYHELLYCLNLPVNDLYINPHFDNWLSEQMRLTWVEFKKNKTKSDITSNDDYQWRSLYYNFLFETYIR